MKQSERLVLLEENKQEIERLQAELQRRKGIVSDLLDGCDHTDGNGNSLIEEMNSVAGSVSTHTNVCTICGTWLSMQTTVNTVMGVR